METLRAESEKKARGLAAHAVRIRDLFNSGKTILEIAAEVGCSATPVKKTLKCLGLKRPAARRKGISAGKNNPAWKGGRRIRTDGYVMIWTPEGERLEHQVVMERHLGRPLAYDEVVHHLNGSKEDNRIENLRLMTQAEHLLEHRAEMQAAKNAKFQAA